MSEWDEGQTARDLEFDKIQSLLVGACVQPTAKSILTQLRPRRDLHSLAPLLYEADEFMRVRTSVVSFPPIVFEEIAEEIQLLQMRDSVLSEISFQRIGISNELVNRIITALEGLEEACPRLHAHLHDIGNDTAINDAIAEVFDTKWMIRDDASDELRRIRSSISEVRRAISKNFSKVLKECAGKGFLGDTGEAYLNDRKVLAIYSTHKRKVAGIVVGSSKTGALTYIEPEVNIPLNFELEALIDDERQEIRKILKTLTHAIRKDIQRVRDIQRILTHFDMLQAKTRVALMMNASLPELSPEPVIELRKAFHPILWLNNKELQRTTYPQDIHLNRECRMLVISGPNAGGKSITLKTVGLLQWMLQCGLLVPVAPGSKMSCFMHILTDIGDNQSIENQLSTYSYRLRRMRHFLEVSNRRSLVLLDEFGTGSDPDLGGAMAEVFFEELYARKSFGVITTHYGNIKLSASKMKQAINGCMLFNHDTLEPTYKLSVGQPGSSFTFEVAQKNGIQQELIQRAKQKLSKQKVQMDQLLSELQEEKNKFAQLSENAQSAGDLAGKTIDEYDGLRKRLEEKIQKQQETIEKNNKFLQQGRKLVQFIESYNLRTKNKELLEDVKKYMAMEKAKLEDARKQKTVQSKVKKQREEKIAVESNREKIAVGSLVRLRNTKQTGTVLNMDKGIVTVAIGMFRTKVDLQKLDFIQ